MCCAGGIPAARSSSRALLSCSRTLFHLLAVLQCWEEWLYIVMVFKIWDVRGLFVQQCVSPGISFPRDRALGRGFLHGIRNMSLGQTPNSSSLARGLMGLGAPWSSGRWPCPWPGLEQGGVSGAFQPFWDSVTPHPCQGAHLGSCVSPRRG